MEYKVGDKVRVRQWEAMTREYKARGIPRTYLRFTPGHALYSGQIATITEKQIWENGVIYRIKEDRGVNAWVSEMFESIAFKYGERVLVGNSESDFRKGRAEECIYVGFIDGDKYPYKCVKPSDEDKFEGGKLFETEGWKYAQRIQGRKRIVMLTIEGKRFEVNREVYEKLKAACHLFERLADE